jgi:hypothetical protein
MFPFEQGGLLPALRLDRDAADVITGSEHILKAYADKHSLTAAAIVDLIKTVLKNPEFNADDVDTDMLQRLQAAIDRGEGWRRTTDFGAFHEACRKGAARSDW